MVGMNAKDALGALEDISIYRDVAQATEDRVNATENERAFRAAAIALRERADTIQRLQDELDEVQHNRNVATLYGNAAVEGLNQVMRDYARAIGVSEDEIRRRYNTVRTQYFNRQVNEGIGRGSFKRDPRLQAAQWKWFVPGLDAEHGF